MMKILYIPTGNTFTLPDEEALRVMVSDRANYKILEGGLQKEAEEKLPPETVKEIVMQKPEEVIENDQKDAPKEEQFDYINCTKHEAIAFAKKLGIKGVDVHMKKTEVQDLIREKLGR